MILLQDAVGLNEHDRYVCHDYRDPFGYRASGYRECEIHNGQIVEAPVEDIPKVEKPSSSCYETWL